MKKSLKICLIILTAAVVGAVLLFGGAEVLKRMTIHEAASSEAETETGTVAASEAEAVSEAETAAETAAEVKAGTESAAEKPKKTISEYEMDSWANEIYESAMDAQPSDGIPKLPLSGKIILAYHDSTGCNVYSKRSMMAKTDPFPEAPYFQAVFSDGTPKYEDVPESVWADSFEECDYLIVYGGFEVSRNAGYYEGGADRVTTKTVVYVLDPKEKVVLLSKDIGVDAPGSVTDHTTGRVLYDEADAYITYLLTGQEEQ